MLETVLMYLNNWFAVGRYDDTYIIEDGGITLPFLANGQYFRIVGSLFNDGVYQYPAELTDETFTGSVWALAIPKALLSTVEEITAWTAKTGMAGRTRRRVSAGTAIPRPQTQRALPWAGGTCLPPSLPPGRNRREAGSMQTRTRI